MKTFRFGDLTITNNGDGVYVDNYHDGEPRAYLERLANQTVQMWTGSPYRPVAVYPNLLTAISASQYLDHPVL